MNANAWMTNLRIAQRPSRLVRMPRASGIARPAIGGTMSERPRAGASNSISSFAKSDDDVGLLARDARAARLRQKL
jgi:hypothetical protein